MYSSRAMQLAAAVFLAAVFAGCATNRGKPELPYPAFVDTGEIEEQFLATLPGVRAREFASDMRSRSLSARVDIPPDWKGTTGGEPGLALEIFVLSGQLSFSDIALGPGGYAYVPPGSMGFRLVSDFGAQVLYFLSEVDERAMIRSPLILDSSLVEWAEVSPGVFVRELRLDPGTGARTWLERIEPGAKQRWASSSAEREGYLVAGQYFQSECDNGEGVGWEYLPGGYFRRPAGVLHGGPGTSAVTESTWFLREQTGGTVTLQPACLAATEDDGQANP